MRSLLCRPSQQITTGDVLQGLVLLGLLINQAFLVSTHQVHSSLLHDHHPDLPVQFMVQLLVSGQFDRMGSFLIGLGLYQYWQKARLDGSGLDADRITRRLLIGLLGIGLPLGFLLGSADLLVPYPLLGFTLLFVRTKSVASLLGWMVGLALLAMLVLSWLALLHPAVMTWQSQAFSRYLSYALMMLGGWLVGKLGINHRDPRLRVRLSLFQVGLLPVAFLVKGAWVVFSLDLVALPQRVIPYQPLLLALSGFCGPSLLTLVYVLDVGINTGLPPSRWARWIGRVGQIGLTNYVLQSILCQLLLDGYGLVLPDPLTFWGRAGIVVGLYTFQLILSYIWLRHYRLGPLEWVTHHWIYGKGGQSNAVPTAIH